MRGSTLDAYDRWVGNGCDADGGLPPSSTIVDLGYVVNEAGEYDERIVEPIKRLHSLGLRKCDLTYLVYDRMRMLVYVPPSRRDAVLAACPEIQPAPEGSKPGMGGYGGWCTHVWQGAE